MKSQRQARPENKGPEQSAQTQIPINQCQLIAGENDNSANDTGFIRGRKGVVAIGSGGNVFEVSGLNLGWKPTVVLQTISKIDTGLIVPSVVVEGSISEDGFTVETYKVTDSENYRLHFLVL